MISADAEWIMKVIAIWGVLLLFALVMFIAYNEQQSKQRAIDTRCNTPHAGQTETLSQLAARSDFFQQLAESVWHASNCQQRSAR